MNFAEQLQAIMRWIDTDARDLQSPDDLRDAFRDRVLDLTHKLIAFPACDNFRLMPLEPPSSDPKRH